MSASPESRTDTAASSVPTTEPAESKPPRRRRRWLLIVILVAVLLRITLSLALPSVLQSVAESQGFNADFEGLDLTLFGADIELRHLELTPVDGSEAWLHAEYLRIDLSMLALFSGDVLVRRVELDGLDIDLERDADTVRPRGAGRGKVAAQDNQSASDDNSNETVSEDPSDAPGEPPSLALPVRLDALRLQHVRVHVHDVRTAETRSHELELNLRVSDLNAANRITRLSVNVTSPALLDTLLIEGSASFAEERIDAEIHTELRGLRLRPWQSELAAAGLELATPADGLSMALDLAFGARVEGEAVAYSAQLGTLELRHASAPPIELESLSVEARQLPEEGLVIDLAQLAGLRVVLNDSIQGVGMLGMLPAPEKPEARLPVTPPSAPSGAPLRVQLKRLEIEDVSARYERAPELGEALEVHLDRFSLEGLDTQAPDNAAPATLAANLRLPGLLEALQLDGTVALHGAHGNAQLALRSPQIDPDRVRTQLLAAGAPAALSIDDLQLDTELNWSALGLDTLQTHMRLGALHFEEGGEVVELPVVLSAELSELRSNVEPTGLPSLSAFRVELGVPGLLQSLSVDGEITPQTNADELSARMEVNGLDLGGARFALGAESPLLLLDDVKAGLRAGVTKHHGSAGVTDVLTEGALHLNSLAPPRATFGASLTNFSSAEGADPARFEFKLAVPRDLAELQATGELALGAETTRVDLELAARGLALRDAAMLLPPGVEAVMNDGRLKLALQAELGAHRDGGQQLDIALRDLDYREAGAEQAWFGIERAAVRAERLDSARGVLLFDELAVEGVRAAARRDTEGALIAGGFRLAPVADAPATDDTPLVAAAPAPVAPTEDLEDSDTGVDEALDTAAAQALVAAGKTSGASSVQRLQLERLNVQLAELSFDDGQRAPLVLRDLTLRNPEPLHYDAEHGDTASDVALELRGEIDPLGVQLSVDALLQPFEAEPRAQVDLLVHGINGERLQAWDPSLAQDLDTSELSNGQLALRVQSTLEGSRSDPLDFAFREGRTAELRVENLSWRAADEGPQLAGVREIQLRLHGAAPGATLLHVEELEVHTPMLHAQRDAEGLHVLGLLIPAPGDVDASDTTLAASEAQPTAADTATDTDTDTEAVAADAAASETVAAEAAAADQAADQAAEPGQTLLIDSLRVSGLDVQYADLAAEPHFYLPLEQLDLSLRDFAFGPDAPERRFRANMFLASGRVPNPDDPDAAAMLLFEDLELRLDGPMSDLRARLNLAGLNLGAFEGAVSDSGVKLEGGRLDFAADVRAREGDGLEVSARAETQQLDLSEGANGPIERFLRLPAPLDPVLFALRDESGAITIPLKLDVPPDGLSMSRIATLSIQTLGGLITDALAAAPLRVLGGVGSMVGLDFRNERAPLPPAELEFLPSEIALEPVSRAHARSLIELLRERPELTLQLEHRLGTLDLERATERLKPAEDFVRGVVAELRVEQARLRAQRPPLLAAAQAALAAGPSSTTRSALKALSELELERGELEARLDMLLGLIGRDRVRNLERDRRAGLLVLAEERLARVRAVLGESAPDLLHRVRLRRPRRGDDAVDGAGLLLVSFRRQVEL
ncbi:MAG: hypothetical protein DHS20C15_25460 [Planctomycetota bacterium]|nr:MAG: hypothetical protein DHS20C15_25460 [Planctomycetota bacterium]